MQLLQRDMFREMYLCVLLRARHCCAVIQVMCVLLRARHCCAVIQMMCVLLRARHCCAVIQVMADVNGPLRSVLNVNNSAVADFEDRTSSNLEVDSQIGLTEVGYWSSVLLMVL